MIDDFENFEDVTDVPEDNFVLDEVEALPAPPEDAPQQSDLESPPAAPEEVLPPDLPPQDDSSVGDVLDSFLAGVLAGVSADSTADETVDEPLDGSLAELDEPLICVGIDTYSLSPIVSADGLKGILLELLGPYDTVVTQYRYQQGSNQYYSYVNDIQPDYPWIASAVLFIALLLSLFHLLGRLFSWMK